MRVLFRPEREELRACPLSKKPLGQHTISIIIPFISSRINFTMGVHPLYPYPSNVRRLLRTSCLIFIMALWILIMVLWSIASAQTGVTFGGGRRKVWTDQPDWKSGYKQTRVTSSKVPGQIQLDLSQPVKIFATPYLYVPNSASNTLTQIDTQTGKKLWSISLQSAAIDGDPSRTTVDVNGNVWVGLRRSNKVILVSKAGKILKEVVTGGVPRAITVDLTGNIWVGNWASNTMVQLDGSSGKILKTLPVPCAYGATTDIHGNIWVVNRCRQQTITKLSGKGQILGVYPAKQGYGIATDAKGQIWVAHYEKGCVYRFSNRGKNLGCIKLGQGCTHARGVAVDGQENIWVVCSNKPLLFKLNSSGKVLGYTRRIGGTCVGLAVDANNFIWVISRTDNTATKVNTKTMKTVGTYSTHGLGPYTYSDMTGFQFQRVARSTQGTWRAVHSSPCVAKWKKIYWNGRTPHGSSIIIRARTAPTRSALETSKWSPPLRSGIDPKLTNNPWIEIEVKLRTFDRNVTPAVTDLTVEYDSVGTETCNGADDDCDGIIDNIPGSNQPLLKSCKNACGKGVHVCSGGQWRTCTAPQPGEETCNGRDDDCDGQTDEAATCKDTLVCVGGACVTTCKPNCPTGTTCKNIKGNDVCVGTGDCKTLVKECTKNKQVCRNGRCVDPCAGVVCKNGTFCVSGSCQKKTCFATPFKCSDGQICKDDKCIPDPCKNAGCDANQACKNGKCVTSCAKVKCGLGRSCKNGSCEKDPCADVLCPPGGICSRGKCYKDPCQTISCPNGQVCIGDSCKADPCIGVQCPKQQICLPPYGDCYRQPYGRAPTQEYIVPPDGIAWSPPTYDGSLPPEPGTPNTKEDKALTWPLPDQGSSTTPKAVGCNCAGSITSGAFPIFLLFFLIFLGYLLLVQHETEES